MDVHGVEEITDVRPAPAVGERRPREVGDERQAHLLLGAEAALVTEERS